MIYVGVGANLPALGCKSVLETCEAALNELSNYEMNILEVSPWYWSSPVPASQQPWFINAVVSLETILNPFDLLKSLHKIEAKFGRVRQVVNGSRTLDLDLLDYRGCVSNIKGGLTLPHPRLRDRAFVLVPLHEISASWTHPVDGMRIKEMIHMLPKEQIIKRVS